MGIVLWIIVGAIAGWIAAIIVKDNSPLLNIVVGVIGAPIGFLLAPLFSSGAETINLNDISLSGLLVSLGGAIILLLIINLLYRSPSVR